MPKRTKHFTTKVGILPAFRTLHFSAPKPTLSEEASSNCPLHSYVQVAASDAFATARAVTLGSFTPVQVASLYGFPKASGAGQTIAVVQLGGGFRASDMATYFSRLGLPVPSIRTMTVSGGANNPADISSSMEVVLDIQVAGAVAPAATILVVFAANTFPGFCAAVQTACANASIVSISWGAPEALWPSSALSTMNSILEAAYQRGVNIFVASGDNGSGDGVGPSAPGAPDHADFPASSPFVIACGGTTLTATPDTIIDETVWASGGGAFSATFPCPSFQRPLLPAGSTKRGVPDVSGCADPRTGFSIFLNGRTYVVGGTSAVAPLYAGLAARLRHLWTSKSSSTPVRALPRVLTPVWYRFPRLRFPVIPSAPPAPPAPSAPLTPFPKLLPLLYSMPTRVAVDVTAGSNGAFVAGTGWDAASGLGRVDGSGLAVAVSVPVSV